MIALVLIALVALALSIFHFFHNREGYGVAYFLIFFLCISSHLLNGISLRTFISQSPTIETIVTNDTLIVVHGMVNAPKVICTDDAPIVNHYEDYVIKESFSKTIFGEVAGSRVFSFEKREELLKEIEEQKTKEKVIAATKAATKAVTNE